MEDRALRQEGCDDLKGTRYAWLSNHGPAVIRMSDDDFSRLRRIAQKTARAWAMKETARAIWDCRRRWEAEAMWKKLIGWMKRSRLEPMQKLATTIKTHLRGILNAAVYAVSNAFAESINAKNPEDKEARMRLQESRPLHRHHLLPPRRPRPTTRAADLHELVMRQSCRIMALPPKKPDRFGSAPRAPS
jgi:hypothetical protein